MLVLVYSRCKRRHSWCGIIVVWRMENKYKKLYTLFSSSLFSNSSSVIFLQDLLVVLKLLLTDIILKKGFLCTTCSVISSTWQHCVLFVVKRPITCFLIGNSVICYKGLNFLSKSSSVELATLKSNLVT